MNKELLSLACFLFLLVSCENKKTETFDDPYTESSLVAEKLYAIASVSKKLHAETNKENTDEYTRAITEAYLIGILNKTPINVMLESVGIDPDNSFNIKDPLGWNDYLQDGAIIKNESDIGLIVLEGKPLKYSRVILDAVAYDKDELVFKDEFDYKNLGVSVMKEMDNAKKVYAKYINDLKKDGAQWVE